MVAPQEGNTTQRRLPSHVFREPGPWATRVPEFTMLRTLYAIEGHGPSWMLV